MRHLRLLAILTISISLFACSRKGGGPQARPAPAVTVAPVEVRDLAVEVNGPVDLRPIAQADVASKTLGYLDAVLVERGDRVRRGQLLALVRPADLPDQLAAARESLAQAQAAQALARANKERADQRPTPTASSASSPTATTRR